MNLWIIFPIAIFIALVVWLFWPYDREAAKARIVGTLDSYPFKKFTGPELVAMAKLPPGTVYHLTSELIDEKRIDWLHSSNPYSDGSPRRVFRSVHFEDS